MPSKIPHINRIISTYGSYAKPFLNWALEMAKIPPPWKHYFIALKFYWKREYFLSLAELEKALDKCNSNKTLYYLILTEKLSILSNINSREGNAIYEKLKREFPYIPSYVRNIASPSLLHYYATNFPSNLRKFRIWSNKYPLDPSSKTFILLGKAREEIKGKNIRKAISYYSEAFRTSLSIPHPTGIINSLNDASWYLKEKHPKFSLLLAKKAVYYSAWYREDLSYDFAVLDTLFEVQRINNDPSICETSMIIQHYYKSLPNSSGKYTKEHYKKLFEFSKKFCFNLETSFYENDGKRINIFENFQKSIEILNSMSKNKREILILSTFMSICNRKMLFPFISKNLKNILAYSESIKKIINLANKNFEIIRFLSYISTDHPFLKARKDLATKFLETLHPNKKEFFISFYLSLKEKEREFIDTFIRNYVRYDRDWNIKIHTPEEIIPFIKKFQLKELPSSLAYFSFEKRERREFDSLINHIYSLFIDQL